MRHEPCVDGWVRGLRQRVNQPQRRLARRYSVGDTQYFSIVAGRLGGYAVKSVNGAYYLQTPALTTSGTMIVSFGYRTDYAIQAYGVCVLYDGDTQGVTLNLTANGELQVLCGADRVGIDRRPGHGRRRVVLH